MRQQQNKERLVVVIPVYNERECLSELFHRVHALRVKMQEILVIETLFVDDGSKDGSTEILQSLSQDHDFVRVITFPRNFGHQLAVTAGLDFAEGDYVAILDADLQDPPELLEPMFSRLKEGYDVVYGQRQSNCRPNRRVAGDSTRHIAHDPA